jgi:hypothetical protein
MPKAAPKLLLSVLLTIGCQKQPQRVFVAAPPVPSAQPAVPPSVEASPPPQVNTPTPQATPLPPVAPADVPPAPPLPARAKTKRPAPAKKETPIVVSPDPAEPSPTPVPAPQLSEVISPQRRRGMDADIDKAIHSAQINLQAVAGKNLTAQQTAAAAQAASFLRQAVEVRSQDLSAARSLAQRAEVIARDLAKTVK